MLLSKADDRFTVCPSSTASASNDWAATTAAKLNRRVGLFNLEEYLVAPSSLEAAMQAARASDAVALLAASIAPRTIQVHSFT